MGNYNVPTSQNYLAAVVVGDMDGCDGPRIMQVRRSGETKSTTGSYDPMSYVVLHPHGQSGWDWHMKKGLGDYNKCTLLQYYKFYFLHFDALIAHSGSKSTISIS